MPIDQQTDYNLLADRQTETFDPVLSRILEDAKNKNIRVKFGDNPTQKQLDLLEESLVFFGTVSDALDKKFRTLLKTDPHFKTKDPSGKIFDNLEKRRLIRSSFTIMDYEHAREFLGENQLMDPVSGSKYEDVRNPNNSLFVAFNLPKPLAHWWDKGKGSWGEKYVDTNNEVIEWGRYYRELLPVVWDYLDEYGDEPTTFLINRINDVSQHLPNKYYYVWQIFRSPGFSYTEEPKDPPLHRTLISQRFAQVIDSK